MVESLTISQVQIREGLFTYVRYVKQTHSVFEVKVASLDGGPFDFDSPERKTHFAEVGQIGSQGQIADRKLVTVGLEAVHLCLISHSILEV